MSARVIVASETRVSEGFANGFLFLAHGVNSPRSIYFCKQAFELTRGQLQIDCRQQSINILSADFSSEIFSRDDCSAADFSEQTICLNNQYQSKTGSFWNAMRHQPGAGDITIRDRNSMTAQGKLAGCGFFAKLAKETVDDLEVKWSRDRRLPLADAFWIEMSKR